MLILPNMQKKCRKVWRIVKKCVILPAFLKLCEFSNAATKNEHINTITTPEQKKLWRLLLCSYDKFDEYCST